MFINYRFARTDFDPCVVARAVTAFAGATDRWHIANPFTTGAVGIAEQKCVPNFGLISQGDLKIYKWFTGDSGNGYLFVYEQGRQAGANGLLRVPSIAEAHNF